MKKSAKQFIVVLALCILFSALPLSAGAVTQTDELKVGFVSNYGTIKATFELNSEGYGYEYLNHLATYMDGQPQVCFVSCTSWEDGMDKLASGEIDILGPTIYNNSGYDCIYTAHDFGVCTILLASLNSQSELQDGLTHLNGATIGVPDYYPDYSILTDCLEAENIDAQVIPIPSLDLNFTIGSSDIDYIWMTSLQTQSGLTVVNYLDDQPVYYIAMPDNQALLDDIDRALVSLTEAEPFYESQLSLKYSSYNFTANSYISEENIALLQEKGTYCVGIRNFYSPLILENESGELEGVAFVLMDMITQATGATFEYVILEDDATDADYEKADFLIAATNSTDELGFPYVSSPYLDLPFILLERRDSSTKSDTPTVGVASYYRTDDATVDGLFYGREVVKYTTIHDLQQAFDAGEIDSMLITVVSLNTIRDEFETQDYVATTIDDTLQLAFAFSDNLSADEMTIFNKLITSIDQTSLEMAMLTYTVTEQDNTLATLIANNPLLAVNALMIVFLAVAITVALAAQKRRIDLATLMNVDSITGLMTERKFVETARLVLQEDLVTQYRIVVLDIDNFKYINEIFGYEIGSKVLEIVGEQLNKRATPQVLVARSEADRFFIFTTTESSEVAVARLDEDVAQIRASLANLIGRNYKLYFSIGVYDIVDRENDVPAMIDYANLARQQGKERAGNSICTFTQAMKAERSNNNEFTSVMEQALEDEEFILFYQPKIDMKTQAINGAEALVRWQRANERMPPYHFIPLFEKNGFIEQLDYYVLGKACSFLQAHGNVLGGRLSVNLSGITMLQDDVVTAITDIVADYGVSSSALDLEITETAFVDSSFVLEKVQALRGLGFTISMDDFGAGISSLNRLKNIQVDTLKIDREFIIDAIDNPRGRQILEHVMRLANSLELETVAEGIETLEQKLLLESLGCDIGQGFYYARPMPEDEILAFCKTQNPIASK